MKKHLPLTEEEIDCAQVAIDLLHAAERELRSFVSAVRELFVPSRFLRR